MKRFGADFPKTAIARAMNCSSCHQPERLGYLNWQMDKEIISSFIKGGKMPLGHNLNRPERRDLYAKLIQEYFAVDSTNPGILQSWLLAKK